MNISIRHLIDFACQWLSEQVSALIAPGSLRSLINDGVIGGVGGVLTFVPQIAVLFVLIAVLEDCGLYGQGCSGHGQANDVIRS